MREMGMRSRFCLFAVAAALAGCAHTASVAVHPITGQFLYSYDKMLKTCDQSAKECKEGNALAFSPTGASFSNSGNDLVFVSSDGVFKCNGQGHDCAKLTLTFSDPQAVSGSATGQIVVVSGSGKLNVCGAHGCKEP